MQYTILGKTGLKVSRLGFGGLHFPMKSKTSVDRDLAIPLLRRGCELGINFFDTSQQYCAGESQEVLGEALEGVRDKVILSTKNRHFDKTDKDTWWKNLTNSLKWLRTDYIDIYNLHGLNYDFFQSGITGEDGLYMEMLKAKEQGLIRHICFSFHGPNEQLEKLVDTGLFDTVIVQYHLLDLHLEDGIARAAAAGMGVIIMGPVGGGRLAHTSEKAVSLISGVETTPALALRFVFSNKNVHVALSGMANMRELGENVETVSSAGELTEQDHRAITAAVDERKRQEGAYCTGCKDCMPCAAGVDVPANFEILNLERVFGLTQHARQRYAQLDAKAALCDGCGECVGKCPQRIDIPKRLAEAAATLDERAGKVGGWCELRGGSLKEGALHLRVRYILKNFSDGVRSARVQFLPHGADRVRPAELEFEQIGPFGRKQEDIEISAPYPAETCSLDVVVGHNGEELTEHFGETISVAPRVEGHSLDASRRRAGPLHVPSPLQPVEPRKGIPEGHSLDFAASYDDENLYVFVEVTGDLPAPAEEAKEPRYLRVYLDGRTPYMIGHGKYDEGVAHLTLHPPAEGGGEVRAEMSNEAQVKALGERTPTGYRVDCAVPWSAFAQVPVPPGVIGFDIGMAFYDPGEERPLMLNWTGRPNGDTRPSAFGKLVMV